MGKTTKVNDAAITDSKYEGRVTPSNGEFYALVVRVDKDGQESVIHGYKGKYFKTREAANKSVNTYIQSKGLNTKDTTKDASEEISISKVLAKFPVIKFQQ
jgi:hypothetical protein